VQDFLFLVIQKNQAGRRGQRHNRLAGCPTINQSTLDWVPNSSTGGLMLPTRDQALPEPIGNTANVADATALVRRLLADPNAPAAVISGVNVVHPDFPLGSLTVSLTGDVSYSRFERVAALYSDLPPFFQNAPGFRAIAESVKASGHEAARFLKVYGGYNFVKFQHIAQAVDTVTRALPALRQRCPDAVLLDPNYASSYYHNPDEFTTLVENLINPSGVPLFLRRHTIYGGSVNAGGLGGAGSAAHGLTTVEFTRQVDQLTGLTNDAVGEIHKSFTGKLDTLQQLSTRYAQPDGTPLIAANLGATGAGGVALDPQQAGMAQPDLNGNLPIILAALPPLAVARFTAVPPGNVGAGLLRVAAVSQASRTPVTNAYDSILKLLFQYRPSLASARVTEQEARDYIASETLRTVLLSLVSMVNTKATRGVSEADNLAAIVARINHLFSNLIDSIARGLPTAGTAAPDATVFPQERVLAEVERFFALPETQRLKVFDSSRTLDIIQRTIGAVYDQGKQVADNLARTIRRDGASAGGAAPRADLTRLGVGYDSNDYLRSPLIGSDIQLESYVGNATAPGVGVSGTPMAVYGDPLNKEIIISTQNLRKYAEDIREGRAVPPALAADRALLHAAQLPASSNVLALRSARLLPKLSTGGTLNPGEYMDAVRRQETYQAPPASRGMEVQSALGEEEEMDTTPQQVAAYQRPTSLVGQGVGSIACIRNDIDQLFQAGTFQEQWAGLEATMRTDLAVGVVARIICSTPTDKQNIEAFLDGNVLIPFTVVLTRPLIVFHTYT
jgi:hypothetical protein